jgi:hypothetical protein
MVSKIFTTFEVVKHKKDDMYYDFFTTPLLSNYVRENPSAIYCGETPSLGLQLFRE